MPTSHDGAISGQLSKANYRHRDLTKRDMMTALQHYRGLQPKQEKFIFNDGNQRELVNLEGTVPVPYKGQTYNIPLIVWLLDTHPYHAPMCYIKPTNDMQIKVSKHVDHTGKIYLPYLHEWKYPGSDLIGLLQICIVIFSEQPPVYSKPKETTPNLPYPVQGQGGYSGYPMPGQQPYPQQQQPAYPGASPSVYPPYPPTTNPPAYPAQFGGYPPATQGYPPATQGYPPQQASGYNSQTSSQTTTGGTVTQEHLRMSILSAVEDKIRRRLGDEFATRQAETDSIRKTGEELSAGRSKLSTMVARLQQESTELDNNIQILTDKQKEMSELSEKLEESSELDVDEAVIPTAPLYKQLINAFAEEAAIDDTIYYLGKALGRGVIDIDSFLKQARILSRKQFVLRATMQKCRKTAGLKV